MFAPLLSDYSELIKESKICEYQYVLASQKETETEGAEKYCLDTLDSIVEGYLTDEISIYGIEKNSKYINKEIPENEVLVSNGVADKFDLETGDTLTLKEPYGDETYDFKVGGVYTYDGTLCVFMNREDFIDTFDKEEDYFTGYFANKEIKDISDEDILTCITGSDLVAVADQLLNSMGERRTCSP